MSDEQTIRFYDDQAEGYARMTDAALAVDPRLTAFIAACPASGRVLDLGCGPGAAAARMADAGLQADAVDAAAEMVALAARHNGVRAWQARFEDIDAVQVYDGIWANFSLLHAPRADMPDHLGRLHRALRPGGVLHIALKTGEGEKRDRIGRLYTYFTDAELTALLTRAGFTVTERHTGCDVGYDGVPADWIAMLAHG
ncbi:MAG: class I SAM-dependent methyltransferase [Rhodobacteraceae bacterium]|nr:class I SAM-dependent methyltransferase [Paracoccaceae bacterium]